MTSDIEIDRALAAVSATLNDQRLEEFDRRRIQQIVEGSLGGELKLSVDDGGGLHDAQGTRVGAVRRLPDGSWHVERQNAEAHNASAEIPTPSRAAGLRRLLTKAKLKLG
jgi:hypothetical protein